MWEAPVLGQRTSVGLDVHTRSVAACGIDGQAGEVWERRLAADHGEITEWIRTLPPPVAVTYEAGPTGFGLARSLAAAGIECVVAAPSKLVRPAGRFTLPSVGRHLNIEYRLTPGAQLPGRPFLVADSGRRCSGVKVGPPRYAAGTPP
jgi:hypothetical protein